MNTADRAESVPRDGDRLRLLRAREVCELLSVGKSTLYDLHASGRLPAYRLGDGRGGFRFALGDVVAFIESRREP